LELACFLNHPVVLNQREFAKQPVFVQAQNQEIKKQDKINQFNFLDNRHSLYSPNFGIGIFGSE
jgi:hypothetical protein